MQIKIEEKHGGFIVSFDGVEYVYESKGDRILQMLEEIGKKVYGKRVAVTEK